MAKTTLYNSGVYKKLMKIKADSPILSDKQVSEVYSRFGLKQFKSEEDFWESRKKYSDLQNHLDYEFYKHRDDLIRSGQYEAWRAGIYKKEYITTMKQYGIDSDIIDRFERMSDKDFGKLYEDTKGRGGLPSISIYASDAVTDAVSINQWEQDLRAYLGMNETPEQHRVDWIMNFFPRKYRDQIDYQKLREADNPEAYLASILIKNNDFFAKDKRTGKEYGFRRGWTRQHSYEVYKQAVATYGKGRRKKK